MDTFDFVIIGAGPAGEAAAYKARERGASVAVIDEEWFGGSCPHIGCLPSKALLHSADEHEARGDAYPWSKASAHRDFMINRPADAAEPDDSGHKQRLDDAGAATYRGHARIVRRGHVEVRHDGQTHLLDGRNVIVAVGSSSKAPPLPGLDAIHPWTNREATLTRELPRSLIVLGGGPTGCEMAQVFARFGVPTTIVQSGDRAHAHRSPPELGGDRGRRSRSRASTIRLGVRAEAVKPRAGRDGAHVIELDDGSTAEGHEVLLAVGRSFPLDDIGLEHYGIDTSNRTAIPRDGRLRLAEGLWLIGDPAGPELHTHQGHYQGEVAVRMALGDDVRPDYRALPRATYTDPEASFVGMTLDQAKADGLDAFELVAEYASSTKGYAVEATVGHVTIIVDRGSRQLVGAAMACPDASAAIHECVVAIKARVPIDVLADTIHAFPSTSRIFNGLFADALRELDKGAGARSGD